MSYPVNTSFVNQLPISFELPKTYEEAHEILTLILKRIMDATNKKEGSLYYPTELGNFISYFTSGDPNAFRDVFRTVVDFGMLPNATSKSVAHNIQGIDPGGGNPSTFCFTHIYATASNQSAAAEEFIPIPYASTTRIVELSVNSTEVTITTNTDMTAFTVCYVVLEYTKNT